mgnify:FL=1
MNCPVCKKIGQPVPTGTIESLTLNPVEPQDFYLCMSPNCLVAYFSESGKTIPIECVQVPIWYKDQNSSVPICYCAKLTRGEIIEAVKKGATTITEVRQLTGKTQTGECHSKNPSGRCCHNAVQEVIDRTLLSKPVEP